MKKPSAGYPKIHSRAHVSPTFNIVVEIQDRERVAVQADVTEAVDSTLRGDPLEAEIRWMDETGEIRVVKEAPSVPDNKLAVKGKKAKEGETGQDLPFRRKPGPAGTMARDMQINLDIVNNSNAASIFITSKAYYRNRPQKIIDAEAANIPIYVLKSNTPNQIRQLLSRFIHPNTAETR